VAIAGKQADLIDRAFELAAACDRPDLRGRLALVRERVSSPSVRVLVVGEPKKGKSSLVNALVGVPVCPVAEDVATVVPTVIRAGTSPRAALVLARSEATAGGGATADPVLERVEVAMEVLAARSTRTQRPDGGRLVRVEVELPRRLLDGGLELVDTAGVGGVGAVRSLATIDLLPTADAVVVVTDATQEFTAPEMALLRQAAALCPNVVCVVTRTDACPEWRRIVSLNRGHLAAAGLEAPVFAVSSPLALLALQRRDRDLHEESGVGLLADHLREQVVARAEALARRSLEHDLSTVTDHLAMSVRSELAVLEDPAAKETLVQELEAARSAVEDLRRRSARWQQVLNDGVTDLMADIDYDLRDRSRVVTREAEETIEAGDPGALWPEITEWLEQRIAVAVADSFVWAEQRSQWLADQVVDQFARDGGVALPELSIGNPAEALGAVVELSDLDSGRLRVRERLLVGIRGSYSGVLMTGLVTSLAGLALINPISVAAGALLGRKAYRDDKEQRLQRRRNEAKALVRRHLDEVVFQVGKQLKDRLRIVQRTLRDLVTDAVDEMSLSLADALRSAQRSTREASAEREVRIRALRLQLTRIEQLAADIQKAAGAGDAGAGDAGARGTAAPMTAATAP
jgi:GTPase SAR1 family protein